MVVFAAIIVFVSADPVHAQSGPSDEWELRLTVYGWAPGLDGTLAVGEREASVEVTSKELLEALGLCVDDRHRGQR